MNNFTDLDDVLQHYGVKGMKWGVRKDRRGSGVKKAKRLSPSEGESRLKNLEKQMNSTKDSKKLKSLRKEYGQVEDSIDYSKPKTKVKSKQTSELALKNLKQKSLKLPNGESISVQKEPPPALAKFLGKVSPKLAEQQSRTGILSLNNSEGKKIGDAQIYRENKDELNLVWLGVKKSERGRGVGTAVVQASIGYAKENGIKKLTLEVPGDSPDARHIYEKLGFKATKVLSENDPVWGGLTKMEMDVPQKGIKHFDNLDDILLHYGVKAT